MKMKISKQRGPICFSYVRSNYCDPPCKIKNNGNDLVSPLAFWVRELFAVGAQSHLPGFPLELALVAHLSRGAHSSSWACVTRNLNVEEAIPPSTSSLEIAFVDSVGCL